MKRRSQLYLWFLSCKTADCTSGRTRSPGWPAKKQHASFCWTLIRGHLHPSNSLRQQTDAHTRLPHLEVDLYSVFDSLLQHKRVLLEAVQVSWQGKEPQGREREVNDSDHQGATRLQVSPALLFCCSSMTPPWEGSRATRKQLSSCTHWHRTRGWRHYQLNTNDPAGHWVFIFVIIVQNQTKLTKLCSTHPVDRGPGGLTQCYTPESFSSPGCLGHWDLRRRQRSEQ